MGLSMSAVPRSPSGTFTSTSTSTRQIWDDEKRKMLEKEQVHLSSTYGHTVQSSNSNNVTYNQNAENVATLGNGSSSSSRSAGTTSGEERPPSRSMVIFSVLFYLVAALVMVSLRSLVSIRLRSRDAEPLSRSWRTNGYSTRYLSLSSFYLSSLLLQYYYST